MTGLGGLSSLTGGWKRLQAPTPKATLRLDRARLSVYFTDAAGVRWNRNEAATLAAMNLPETQTFGGQPRRAGNWGAAGLRDEPAPHSSSKS